ncbi:MAG: trypsin-like peptidase domain-containing protein [Zavarzinella sp.]
MSNWYIRIRGKTMGPFPTAEVQQMLATGQVQKYHEISEDKVSWQSIEFVDEFVEEEAAPVRRRKLLRNDDNYESSPAPRGSAKPKKGSSKLGFRILVGSVLTLILAGATTAVILIARNKDDKVADRKNADTNSPNDINSETVYENAVKSCVFIQTPSKTKVENGKQYNTWFIGSGSLIDYKKKLVITNYHVVQENSHVFVSFPKYTSDNKIITDKMQYDSKFMYQQGIKAHVLHRDKRRDLALIELERVPENAGALRLHPFDKPVQQGKTVYTLGNGDAVGQMFNISQGIIRSVGDEEHDFGDQVVSCSIITATNPINQGDSGGPLIDSKGVLVGVTQGKSSKVGTSSVHWFIDSKEVHAFLRLHGIILSE